MATNHVPNEDTRTQTPVTIMTNTGRFATGQIVATPGAIALLEQHSISAAALIIRHLKGSWGDVCAEDAEANEMAIKYGNRIMSVYRLASIEQVLSLPQASRTDLPTVWVITESDRSVTTLLLPSEY